MFTKGVYQSAQFQTFDCSGEISPNLYFDRLLLLKKYKISAKKVERNYIYIDRVMQNLKKNRFVVSKMTRIWWILIRGLKSLKNLNFDWSLSCKVYNVWPKKKEKLTCGLENDLRNLAKFHQNTKKSRNWGFCWVLLSKVESEWA